MDSSEFRRVLGHFATGVTVVTSLQPNREPCGLTVNAFCSVSLEPPLVLACVERDAVSHDCIQAAGVFAVNILPESSGETLSRRFSGWRVADKFQGIAYREEHTGAPVLDEAIAWIDCRLTQVIPAGDHSIFLGEVVSGDAAEGRPLVYYRGGYGHFEP